MGEMEKYIFNYGENISVCMFSCLKDNYGFLVHCKKTNTTACIDTPDGKRIIEVAMELDWPVDQILNTHHHADHAGGNLEVKQAFDKCKVIGFHSDAKRIPGIDIEVKDNELFLFGDTSVRVIHTPGHTLGHIIYVFEKNGIAFVGDTLFSLGCGRVFEGSYEQMWSSLLKIKSLDKGLMIYCAHEYTEANAKFALSVNPSSLDLQLRSAEVARLRKRGLPTIPVKLSDEIKTNPFLGENFNKISQTIKSSSTESVQIFAQIRQLKDSF
jgi:hydroxyacylglutathione hydrolase